MTSFEACMEGFFPSSTPFYTRMRKKGSHPSYFLNDSDLW
ncbi:hypothetical protein HMPREF9442_00314 [Paraprevotella xylaniphila YIT 11841]|uniref:Uncharacterized protein n=1 Tax=Paraprevotella xylaniphila YIT 11841 TaxID=762982 RepID=F3QQ76_9BACT|nr:hypothetical protein HMPREF9442_00314 [Paraprevotella xylaniphila YIT 11841]